MKTKGKRGRIFWKIAATLGLIAVLLTGGLALYIRATFETEIDATMFGVEITDATTRFFYCESGADHRYDEAAVVELGETLQGTRKILYTPFEDIPAAMIHAFVAIEDKRFFEHEGVDVYRSLAAAANYVLGFDSRFGASTITQQLIKNVTGNNEITVRRKIQEILWAHDLEDKLSKEEILTCYLNVINLSEGCYGIGAASDLYFSKPPSALTVAECACMAAITNSPTYYDPIRNPENNKARRDLILTAMYEQGYLSVDEYEEAVNTEITLNVNQSLLETRINSWYVDMVVEDVIADLVAQYGYTRETAARMVYNGGLRIVTAMDLTVQKTLEDYYANTAHFRAGRGETAQSAMIVLSPVNGDILGVVGAVGEKTGNRVQSFATDAKRPSGSTVKPLSVYAPALEYGKITYATVLDDVPVEFLPTATGYKPWPQNASMVYRGLTNVNYALANSLNTIALKVLDKVGIERSFSFLRDTVGVTSLIEREPLAGGGYLTDKAPAALALGQMNRGVTLREMTAAYSIFSNGGRYVEPRSYYKVYDSRGRELLSRESESRYAISSANASVMTKMLEHVISTGTARPITLDSMIDVAGKTGTTQNNCDKWFIAYSPYCLCGVWYGYEYPKPIQESEKNRYLEVWNDVMVDLHRRYYIPAGGRRSFAMDPDVVRVTVCRDSGLLMSTDCYLDPRNNRAEVAYFVKGTEPTRYCDCHVGVDYDPDGGVVCDGCGCEETTRVGLIRVSRSFPMEICVTDAQYVYRALPPGVPPCEEETKAFFSRSLGKRFCGVSPVPVQYNRMCTKHYNTAEQILRRHLETAEPETGNDPDEE